MLQNFSIYVLTMVLFAQMAKADPEPALEVPVDGGSETVVVVGTPIYPPVNPTIIGGDGAHNPPVVGGGGVADPSAHPDGLTPEADKKESNSKNEKKMAEKGGWVKRIGNFFAKLTSTWDFQTITIKAGEVTYDPITGKPAKCREMAIDVNTSSESMCVEVTKSTKEIVGDGWNIYHNFSYTFTIMDKCYYEPSLCEVKSFNFLINDEQEMVDILNRLP